MVIEVSDEEDFPCVDWKDYKKCPMFIKWHEGEERICFKCGHVIFYNYNQEENVE